MIEIVVRFNDRHGNTLVQDTEEVTIRERILSIITVFQEDDNNPVENSYLFTQKFITYQFTILQLCKF